MVNSTDHGKKGKTRRCLIQAPGRLLIVDDEVECAAPVCDTLTDECYATTGAGNGEEALDTLSKHEFDLLLSDLMMPGMDGVQLLRKALEIDPNLVGIIMTGQGTIPAPWKR